MSDEGKKTFYLLGNIIIQVFRWVCFITFIIYLGFTLGTIITSIVSLSIENKTVVDNVMIKLLELFTPYDKIAINTLILNYGLLNVIVGSVAYGIAKSIIFFVDYKILLDYSKIFKSLTLESPFVKSNISILDEIISLSFISAFAYPAILFVASNITRTFKEYTEFSYVGILFLILALILKLIIEKGIVLVKKNKKYDEQIDDYKADIDELKIASIKREAELKNIQKSLDANLQEKAEETEEANKIKEDIETNITPNDETKKKKHHHSRAKKNKKTTM